MLAYITAIALAAAPLDAPVMRFNSPVALTTATGEVHELPPGYYIPEPQFDKLNTEVKRLQAVEREHVTQPSNAAWVIGAFVLGAVVATGVALAVTKR